MIWGKDCLKAVLMGAICASIVNSTAAAAPKAPSTRPADPKSIAAVCDQIAQQVRSIEQQAPKMRRIEIPRDSTFIDVLGTCCIKYTLFIDGRELRKAVVQSWHGHDGFVSEWYFDKGRPIFILETSQFQVYEKDIASAGDKRTTREVRLPKDEPDDDSPPSQQASKAQKESPRLVYCRWQNRYYMDAGRAIRVTTDYPGKDPGAMTLSAIKSVAASLIDMAKRQAH